MIFLNDCPIHGAILHTVTNMNWKTSNIQSSITGHNGLIITNTQS